MKARIKLALGVAFAAAAVMAASNSSNLGANIVNHPKKQEIPAPCYTMSEVELLMKANSWSEQEAKTILDLACQYSGRPK